MGKACRAEVVVIGAGIFGLAVAHACAGRGLRVLVLERGPAPGAGASGGIVGALAPHAPDRWSPAKAFQLAALESAGAFWRGIAAETGCDPGYAQPGRVMPLMDARVRDRAEALAVAARDHWPARHIWRVLDAVPEPLAAGEVGFGAVHDTLSARIAPRRAIAALAAAAAAHGVEVRCACDVMAAEDGRVQTREGEIVADAVVVATGAGPAPGLSPGFGAVKGQAALLALPGAADWPLVHGDGLWVVGHRDGTVAVGATSERDFSDPATTDAGLEAVIARAHDLVPALAGATVVERWAGLRPRARRPQPVLGRLPGRGGMFVAGGGYRIGFGIAHQAGGALAAMIAGEAVALPSEFAPEAHGIQAIPGIMPEGRPV